MKRFKMIAPPFSITIYSELIVHLKWWSRRGIIQSGKELEAIKNAYVDVITLIQISDLPAQFTWRLYMAL